MAVVTAGSRATLIYLFCPRRPFLFYCPWFLVFSRLGMIPVCWRLPCVGGYYLLNLHGTVTYLAMISSMHTMALTILLICQNITCDKFCCKLVERVTVTFALSYPLYITAPPHPRPMSLWHPLRL